MWVHWILLLVHLHTLTSDEIRYAKWAAEIGQGISTTLTELTSFGTFEKLYTDLVQNGSIVPYKKDGREISINFARELTKILISKTDALEAIRLKAEELHTKYEPDENIENVKFFNAKKYNESGAPELKAFDTFIKDKPVNTSLFAYHIPSNVYDSSHAILNNIKMLQNLSSVAINNFAESPSLLWQYVGVPEGIYQVYPGYIWIIEDGIDLYDCRRRGWYLQGISSPKDMLILLDTSGSMSGSKFSTAQVAVQLLISSLQENDFFNIIHFSGTPTYLSPDQTGFIQGTRLNKVQAIEAVKKLQNPTGEADFEDAFIEAFKALKENTDVSSSSRCHQLIMFLTDGNEAFGDVEDLLGHEDNKQVRIFSYQIGRGDSTRHTPDLKRMSCRSGGQFYHLETPGNVWDKMLEYTTVLGYPLALNGSVSTPTYVPIYEDYSGAGMVMSVVQPMFKQKNKNERGILGLAAQDISLTELEDSIPKHILGVDGHGFAINNNGFVLFHPNMKMNDPQKTETTFEAPTLYLKQLIQANRSHVEELTKNMIDEEESYKTLEVAIAEPVYSQKRVRHINMTFYHRHTSDTPFSAAIALPSYSASTYKLTPSRLNISQGLISLSQNMKNFTRMISSWPYCNYTSPRGKHFPATVKVYPNLEELLSSINNTTDNVLNKCNLDLIGRVLLDSIILDHTAARMWNSTKLKTHGIEAIFIGTYSGYSLLLNLSETNKTTVDPVISNNIQENEFYKLAVSKHHDDDFYIVNSREDAKLTISAPIFPDKLSIHTAGVQVTTEFLENIIDKYAWNSSVNEKIYILDEDGYMLQASNHVVEKKLYGAFFGEIEGDVMREMVEQNIFSENEVLDHQGKCLEEKVSSSDSTKTMINPFQWVLSLLTALLASFISFMITLKFTITNLISNLHIGYTDDISGGTIHCITGMKFYKLNHERIPSQGYAGTNACTRPFYVNSIPLTNLVLVVVNKTESLCNKLDWKLFRRSYKISNHALGYNHRKLLPFCTAYHKDEVFRDCSFGLQNKSSTYFITLLVFFSMLLPACFLL